MNESGKKKLRLFVIDYACSAFEVGLNCETVIDIALSMGCHRHKQTCFSHVADGAA